MLIAQTTRRSLIVALAYCLSGYGLLFTWILISELRTNTGLIKWFSLVPAFAWLAHMVMSLAWIRDRKLSIFWPVSGTIAGIITVLVMLFGSPCSKLFASCFGYLMTAFISVFVSVMSCVILGVYLVRFHFNSVQKVVTEQD